MRLPANIAAASWREMAPAIVVLTVVRLLGVVDALAPAIKLSSCGLTRGSLSLAISKDLRVDDKRAKKAQLIASIGRHCSSWHRLFI